MKRSLLLQLILGISVFLAYQNPAHADIFWCKGSADYVSATALYNSIPAYSFNKKVTSTDIDMAKLKCLTIAQKLLAGYPQSINGGSATLRGIGPYLMLSDHFTFVYLGYLFP